MKTQPTLRKLALAALLLAAINCRELTAFAQGTAFTYQGQLSNSDGPANGLYNLSFSLFNTNTGGSVIGTPVTNNAVSVSNGLFTVVVDFGQTAFTGASNWLQIAVATNGSGTFTNLTPRQQLTATPYAIYAESANATNLVGAIQAGNLSGVALLAGPNAFTGNETVTSGNVGIGTSSPGAALDVRISTAFGVGSLISQFGSQALPRFQFYDENLSSKLGPKMFFNADNVAQIAGDGDIALMPNGYVGIGTVTPLDLLDVNGLVGIESTNTLEFGAGIPGKDVSAGKIGYERFTPDSLDIVGAGTNNTGRKIKFWAEGGANFNGNVGIGTSITPRTLTVVGSGLSLNDTNRPSWTLSAEVGQTAGRGADGNSAFFYNSDGSHWNGVMVGDNGTVGILEAGTQQGDGAWGNRNLALQNEGGNVGIGTTSPAKLLDVTGNVGAIAPGDSIDPAVLVRLSNSTDDGTTAKPDSAGIGFGHNSTRQAIVGGTFGNDYLDFYTGGALTAPKMRIAFNGNVGIGTTSPDSLLTVNGTADKPGGGSWGTFSDARLKDVGPDFTHGLDALDAIQPVHYHYKSDNPLKLPCQPDYVGVVAQQVQNAIPEAVHQNQDGYLVVDNDPIIWTMFNAIKELSQRRETEAKAKDAQIADLKTRLEKLEQLMAERTGGAK